MIQFTKICPHCGEEYWDKHECEGTRREAKAAAIAALIESSRLADEVNRVGELMQMYNGFTGTETTSKPHDVVNHPKHYTSHPSGVECIDITKHYNFQIGNAMKYLWRQGLKDEKGLDTVEKQIQDCEKAIWYIQSYINDLKGN